MYAILRQALRSDGDCRVFTSDVKLSVSADLYYYPDVVVACSIDDASATFLDNPCLVVEVLSFGTQLRDRGEKLIAYRQIESLRDYLIVHQDDLCVEYHHRDDGGTWQRADVIGEHASISLPCPAIDLRVGDIYADLPEQ